VVLIDLSFLVAALTQGKNEISELQVMYPALRHHKSKYYSTHSSGLTEGAMKDFPFTDMT